MHPKSILFLLFLSCVLLVIGCSGNSAPRPEDSAVLTDAANLVWKFIENAEKQRDFVKSGEQLNILMETLDAQADEFGGKLIELRDAAKELQAVFQSSPNSTSVRNGLSTLADKVSALSPKPTELGDPGA